MLTYEFIRFHLNMGKCPLLFSKQCCIHYNSLIKHQQNFSRKVVGCEKKLKLCLDNFIFFQVKKSFSINAQVMSSFWVASNKNSVMVWGHISCKNTMPGLNQISQFLTIFSNIRVYIFSPLGLLSKLCFRRHWNKETLVSFSAIN